MTTKTLEQLEHHIWETPTAFPSSMVENCYLYRKIKLSELSHEQLRLLISQQIGLPFSVPLALQKLNENILAEGDLYHGDVLEAVTRTPSQFWEAHPQEYETLKKLITDNAATIKDEIGEKEYDRLLAKFNKTNKKAPIPGLFLGV